MWFYPLCVNGLNNLKCFCIYMKIHYRSSHKNNKSRNKNDKNCCKCHFYWRFVSFIGRSEMSLHIQFLETNYQKKKNGVYLFISVHTKRSMVPRQEFVYNFTRWCVIWEPSKCIAAITQVIYCCKRFSDMSFDEAIK